MLRTISISRQKANPVWSLVRTHATRTSVGLNLCFSSSLKGLPVAIVLLQSDGHVAGQMDP